MSKLVIALLSGIILVYLMFSCLRRENLNEESSFDSEKVHHDYPIQEYFGEVIQRTPSDYDPTSVDERDAGVLGRSVTDLENLGGKSQSSQQYQQSMNLKGSCEKIKPLLCEWGKKNIEQIMKEPRPNLELIGNGIGSAPLSDQVWEC